MKKFIKNIILLTLVISGQVSIASTGRNKMQIMPLGDSITFGINYPGAYRVKLEELLTQNGIDVNFVGSQSNGPEFLKSKNNEGHPGWSIQGLAENTSAWLDKNKPGLILLMIGTNDLWVDDPSQKPDVAASLNHLRALIDIIIQQMPLSRVIVASIPPSPFFWNSYIIEYNVGIQSMVSSMAKKNINIQFADIYNSMSISDLDINDGMGGIHPAQIGYEKIATAWSQVILSK